MGDRWRPDTGQQWLRDTDKRIDILERRWTRGGGGGGGGALNKIINGDFRINQRLYASGAALAPASVLTAYGHDRWRASPGSTTSYTFVQAPNGCTITLNASGALRQVIERANVPAGDYTLSWEGTARNTLGGATIKNRIGNPDTVSGGTAFSVSGSAGSYTAPGVVAGGVVRTNLATDPRATANQTAGSQVGAVAGFSTRWYGSGGAGTSTSITGASDGPLPGLTTYQRITITTAPSTASEVGFNHLGGNSSNPAVSQTTGFPVSPGDVLTVSAYIRASAGAGLGLREQIMFRQSSGLPTVTGGIQSLNERQVLPGGWQRISATVTAPAGAVYMGAASTYRVGTLPLGTTVDGTALLIEKVGSLEVFFSGATTDGTVAGQYQYDWTSTADASTSTQKLLVAGGKHRITATGGVLTYVYAAPPAGEGSIRFSVTSGQAFASRVEVTNPNSFTVYARQSSHWYTATGTAGVPSGVYGPTATLAPGETVTLELTGIVPTAISGNPIVGALPIVWLYATAGFVNPAAGTMLDHTKWAMFSGADAASLDPADPVPYFSGASTSPDYMMAWLAAANQSASTRTETFTGSATFTHDGTNDLIIEFRALGGTATLGKVSLTPGSGAHRFQPRLIGEEVLLAQRYYQRWGPGGVAFVNLGPAGFQQSTTAARVMLTLPVKMRTNILFASGGVLYWSDAVAIATPVTGLTADFADTDNITLTATFAANGAALRPGGIRSQDGTGWFGFSAEF